MNNKHLHLYLPQCDTVVEIGIVSNKLKNVAAKLERVIESQYFASKLAWRTIKQKKNTSAIFIALSSTKQHPGSLTAARSFNFNLQLLESTLRQ
jgi:hypothetical protein